MNTVSAEATLQFPQDLRYLHLVTGTSRLFCETMDLPDLPKNFIDEVELAVSEACTNAIRHASGGEGPATVIVRFRLSETALMVEIIDQGAGFDLEEIPQPEFDRHPEGGYGLYIIRKVMDEVLYSRNADRNILTMKKNIKAKEDPSP